MTAAARRQTLVALIALAAVGAATLWALSGRAASPAVAATAEPAASSASAPRPALTVTVESPRRVTLPQGLSANGNVAAWQEASVGSEANGLRPTEVRAQVGDRVKAGQVLAVFSPDSVQADLNQARAALSEAQAAAADAQANAERARGLQASGALSAQQISQYLTAELTAKARVESAQAAVASQQLRLRHTQVQAPDSGIISGRSATVGAVLPAGTELFRLIRKGRLEWRAEVTSAELPRLKPGQTVEVTAASGASTRGTLRLVAPTVDPQTRAALVYVDLPADTPADIRAGMFARGTFELGQSTALTVPQASVVLRDGFSQVMVVDATGRARAVRVSTGRRAGERIEVSGELAPDARVVVSGAGFLNEGDVVKVVASPPSAPAAPAAVASAPKSASAATPAASAAPAASR